MRYPLMLAALLSLSAGALPAQERASESRDPLVREYGLAVQRAILERWTRPESVAEGQRCVLAVTQLPGGIVVSVMATPDCEYDAIGKRSIETAVLKAQPLPYEGYERVFQRRLNLVFVVKDPAP